MNDVTANSPEESQAPRFFSKAWFKHLATAFKPWKYSAKEHLVWQVSSGVTLTQVFGLKWLHTVIVAKAPWIITGAKAVWSTITLLVLATVEVLNPF